MARASLQNIVRYCDRALRTAKVKDYDGAVNGLQVQNSGAVSRIVAAVDGSLATIRLAIAARADLLLVHHGLFWSRRQPWTGATFQMLRLLLDNNVAVYSSHLPLDAHPKLGNNAQLCALLGLRNLRPFFFEKDQFLGFQSRAGIPRAELARRLQHATGAKALVIAGGPPKESIPSSREKVRTGRFPSLKNWA